MLELETLLIGFETNAAQFDAELQKMTQKAETYAKKIDSAFKNSFSIPTVSGNQVNSELSGLKREYDSLRSHINRNPIKPKVDLNELHEFNRVMAIKKKDWNDLHSFVRRNPIKPKFDGSDLARASREIDGLRKDLKQEISGAIAVDIASLERAYEKASYLRESLAKPLAGSISVDTGSIDVATQKINALQNQVNSLAQSSANISVRAKVQHYVDGSHVGESIKESFSESRSILKGAIKDGMRAGRSGGLLGLPFRAAAAFSGSVFQGVGIAAGSKVASGFGSATDSSLKNLGVFVDKKVSGAIETIKRGLAKAGGFNDASEFGKYASSLADSLFDYSPDRIEKAIVRFEDRLVDVLESLFIDGDAQAAKKKAVSYLREESQGARDLALNTAGAAVRVGAQPFRIRKRVLLKETIAQAEAMVDDVIASMDDDLKAQIKKAKGVTIATGGVDFNRGENAYFSANIARKLTPGNVTIPFVNSRGNDPNNPGAFYDLRQAAGGFGGADPMPIDRMLTDAVITGQNPDAAHMLAQVLAVRKITDSPITLTGSSGGAALVEEVIAAAEKKAINEVKGVGLTLPGYDLTRNASTENYKTMVGTYDPIAIASFGSRFDDGSRYYQKAIKGAPANLNGVLSPGAATAVYPGLGTGHHLGAFVADPNVQRDFTAFTGTGKIDPSYGSSRKAFNYLNQLYSESSSIPRTLDVLLGDQKALNEVNKGEYSFIDPNHLDWRRDDDFQAMIKNFEKLSEAVVDADRPEYDKLINWLNRFRTALSAFYESVNSGGSAVIPQELTNLAKEGKEFFKYKNGAYEPPITGRYDVVSTVPGLEQYTLPPKPNYSVVGDFGQYDPDLTYPKKGAIEQFIEETKPAVVEFVAPMREAALATVEFGKKTREAHDAMVAIARGVEDVVMLGRSDEIKGSIKQWAKDRATNWGTEITPYNPNQIGAQQKGGIVHSTGNFFRGVYGGMKRGEEMAFDAAGLFVPRGIMTGTKRLMQMGGTFAAANALLPGIGGAIMGAGGGLGGMLGTAGGGMLTSWLGGALPAGIGSGMTALAGMGIPGLSSAAGGIMAGSGAALPAVLGSAGSAVGAAGAGWLATNGAMNITAKVADKVLPGDSQSEQKAFTAGQKVTNFVFDAVSNGAKKAAFELKPATAVTAQIEGTTQAQLTGFAGAAANPNAGNYLIKLPPKEELSEANRKLQELHISLGNLRDASKQLQDTFGPSISKVKSGQGNYLDFAHVAKGVLESEKALAITRDVQGHTHNQGFEQQYQDINEFQRKIGTFKARGWRALIDVGPQIRAAAQAGDDTAQGFIDAVKEAEPAFRKVANDKGNAYLDELKDALGVRSPSWKTAAIGRDTYQGFLNEGEAGLPKIEKAGVKAGLAFTENMRASMQADLPEVKATLEKIQAAIDGGDYSTAIGLNKTLPKELQTKLKDVGPNNSVSDVLSSTHKSAKADAGIQLKALGLDKELMRQEAEAAAEYAVKAAGNAANKAAKDAKPVVDAGKQFAIDVGVVPRIKGFFGGIKNGLSDLQRRYPILQKFKGQLMEVGFAIGGLIGAYSLGDFFVNAGRSALQAANEISVFESRLDAIGQGKGHEGFERVLGIADKLGVEFDAVGEQYIQFANSLRYTELSGETDALFESLLKGVRGLDKSAADQYFRALNQVIGKGKLMAEEYNQQLSEIPGIAQSIQRAFGFETRGEFLEEISAGNVSGVETIRKLAKELDNSSNALVNANTMSANFGNQLKTLQRNSGKAIQPAFLTGLKAGTVLLKFMNENAGLLAVALKTLALTIAGVLVKNLKLWITSNFMLSKQMFSLKSLSLGLWEALKVGKVHALALGKALLFPTAIVAGITYITAAIKNLSGETGVLTDNVKKAKAALIDLGQNGNFTAEINKQLENGAIHDNFALGVGDRVLSSINQLKEAEKKLPKFLQAGKSVIPAAGVIDTAFNLLSSKKGRLTTHGEKHIENLRKELGEVEKLTSEAVGKIKVGDEKSIAKAATTVDVLKDSVARLKAESEKNPLLKILLGQDILNSESFLASMEAEVNRVAAAGKEVGAVFTSVQEVLKNITREFEKQNREIQRQKLLRDRSITQGQLNGTITQKQAGILRKQSGILEAQGRIAPLEQQRARKQAELDRGDEAFLKSFEGDAEKAKEAKENLIAEIDQLTNEIEQAYNAIGEGQLELKNEIENQEAEAIRVTRELQKSIKDYYKSYNEANKNIEKALESFIEEMNNQAQDIELETKRLVQQTDLESKTIPLRRAMIKSSGDLVNSLFEKTIDIIELMNEKATLELDRQASKLKFDRAIAAELAKKGQLNDQINGIVDANNTARDNLDTRYINDQLQLSGASALQREKALSGGYGPTNGISAKEFLDSLGPTGTMQGQQLYGAFRGTVANPRKHAGQDYDLNEESDEVIRAGLSGVVTRVGSDPGGYYDYFDIFNKQTGLVERIAEAATVLVKEGDQIVAGQIVGRGADGNTGVVHREIREDADAQGRGGFGYSGTINPDKFYRENAAKIFDQAQPIAVPVAIPTQTAQAAAGVPVQAVPAQVTQNAVTESRYVAGQAEVRVTPTNHVSDTTGLRDFRIEVVDARGDVLFSEIAQSGKAGKQALKTAAQGVAGSENPMPEGTYQLGGYGYDPNGIPTLNGANVGKHWFNINSIPGTSRDGFGIHADVDNIPGSAGCWVFTDPSQVKRLADIASQAGAKELVVDYGLGTVRGRALNSAMQGAIAQQPVQSAQPVSVGPTKGIFGETIGTTNRDRYLARIAAGESSGGTNAHGVSSAGARGYFQFTPESRQSLLDRTGIDAWAKGQAKEAAIAWLKILSEEFGVNILAEIDKGNFDLVDGYLGHGRNVNRRFGQFTSLPGGDEQSSVWDDPKNFAIYGPIQAAGTAQGGGVASGGSAGVVQTSLGLPGVVAPNLELYGGLVDKNVDLLKKQQAAEEASINSKIKVNEINIDAAKEVARNIVLDKLKDTERQSDPDYQKAILHGNYSDLPDFMIPEEVRDPVDIDFVNRIRALDDQLTDAERALSGKIRLIETLLATGHTLEDIGITTEQYQQFLGTTDIEKKQIEEQRKHLENAHKLKKLHEQRQKERERATKDNEINQELLNSDLNLQGLKADALASQGLEYAANQAYLEKETMVIQNQLDLERQRIALLRERNEDGEDTGYSDEQLTVLEDNALESAELQTKALKDKYKTIGATILESTRESVRNSILSIKDLIGESKNAGEFFHNLFGNLAKSIGDMLFQTLANFAISQIFKGIGLDSGGGLFGKLIGNKANGGLVGNRYDGGYVVGNMMAGGSVLGLGIEAVKAVQREKQMNGGHGVGLYALTEGERVLSRKQTAFYEQLMASGMVEDYGEYYGIQNRAHGGKVGTEYAAVVNKQANSDRKAGHNINMPITVNGGGGEDVEAIIPAFRENVATMFNEMLIRQKRNRGVLRD